MKKSHQQILMALGVIAVSIVVYKQYTKSKTTALKAAVTTKTETAATKK